MSALTPYEQQSVNLTGVEEPARLIGGFVSSAFFAGIGVRSRAGTRLQCRPTTSLEPSTSVSSAIPSGAIDSGLTRMRSGRAIILNAEPHTVIGVLAESFTLGARMPGGLDAVQHFPNYARSKIALRCLRWDG